MRCLGAPEPWGPWARAQRAHWIRRPCLLALIDELFSLGVTAEELRAIIG